MDGWWASVSSSEFWSKVRKSLHVLQSEGDFWVGKFHLIFSSIQELFEGLGESSGPQLLPQFLCSSPHVPKPSSPPERRSAGGCCCSAQGHCCLPDTSPSPLSPSQDSKGPVPLREGQQMETAKWGRAATVSLPSPVLSYPFFRIVTAMPSQAVTLSSSLCPLTPFPHETQWL